MINEKAAETLYILDLGSENLLNSLHYLSKASCSDTLKPSFLTKKSMDSILKKISKRFPINQDFISKENCSEITKIKESVLEEAQPYYDILHNLMVYKDSSVNVLRWIFSTNRIDLNFHMNICIHVLQLVTSLVRAFLIMMRINDLIKIIGAYGIASYSINNTFENTFVQVTKFVSEYSDPIKKLSEELHVEAAIKNILLGIVDEFRPCILEGKQMQTNSMFNLSNNIRLIAVPSHSRNPELHFHGYLDFCKWFCYCTILVPNLLSDPMIENLINMMIVQNVVIPLHRDYYINYAKEVAAVTENNKQLAKKIKEINENSQLSTSQFVQFHKDRRDYFRMVIQEARQIIQAQPGLLGPKLDKVIQILCLSFECVHIFFLHFDPEIGKSKKTIVDLYDINILHLITEILLLRDLILKYTHVIRRYYWSFIAEYDLGGIQHYSSTISSNFEDMCDQDKAIINGLIKLGEFCKNNPCEQKTEINDTFMAAHLDLMRMHLRNLNGNSNFYSDTEITDFLNNFTFHVHIVDRVTNILHKCAPVYVLWFFRNGFKMLLNESATPRSVKNYLCASFAIFNDEGWYKDNLCPEERSSVQHYGLESVDEYINIVAQHCCNAFISYWKEHKEIRRNFSVSVAVNTWLTRICENENNAEIAAKLKITPVELPGTESKKILLDEHKEISKTLITLEEFCFTLSLFPQIKIFGFQFYPRQAVIPILEKMIISEISDFSFTFETITEKVAYKFPKRPSVVLSYIKSFQGVVSHFSSMLDLNFDPLFYSCINSMLYPSSISSSQSIAQFYLNWILETFINFNFEDGILLYSGFRQCFVTKANSNIRLDEYTDVCEMRALSQLLGPIGIKTICDGINVYVSKSLASLKKFMSNINWKNFETSLKGNSHMDSFLKKDKSNDEAITLLTKMGAVITLKHLLLAGLKHTVETSAYHLHLALKYGFSQRYIKEETLPKLYNLLGYDLDLDLPLYHEMDSNIFSVDPEMSTWTENFLFLLPFLVGYVGNRGQYEYFFQLETYANNFQLVVQAFKTIVPCIFYHFRQRNQKTLNSAFLELIANTSHVIYRMVHKSLVSNPIDKPEFFLIVINLLVKNNPFIQASQVEKYVPSCLVVSACDRVMWPKFNFKVKTKEG